MPLAYLGTSDFAARVLEGLVAGGEAPALVVTPPDRPKGRGRKLGSPPAADAARELGLELLQTESVNSPDATAALGAAGVDLAMVCAFGQLIGDEALQRLDFLNVHPSLLPRWRGAAPIERAIMEGDEETGVAIIRLVSELDAGPIALSEGIPIGSSDDFGSLSARLAELGGQLALGAIRAHRDGALSFQEQAAAGVTYAEKIGPEDRRLDPSAEAGRAERTVRALHPHVGAYLDMGGDERLGVLRARLSEAAVATGAIEWTGEALIAGFGDGSLELLEVKPSGKRAMDAAAWARGNPALSGS